MKRFFIILILVFLAVFSKAQAPKGFTYQAVVRDTSGRALTNQAVHLRISILRASANGSQSYQETHLQTTNKYGIVNLVIGNGNNKIGTIDTIQWGLAEYFIKIELDVTGGNAFSDMGTVQLQSVPYALYAESTKDNVWEKNGNNIYNKNNGNVGIGTTQPNSKLEVKGTQTNDTLFQVKDANGNPVFVVMPDGVHVIVPENPNYAAAGGFAVSGRSSSKNQIQKYMFVSNDSTRIYITDNNSKAAAGGFAVSGRSSSKTNNEGYFSVNADSVTVSKSLYIPRMTTYERDNLGFTPSEALIIFNTTDECMQIYKNGVWSNIWCFHCAADIITQPLNALICSQEDTSFIISATGTNISYQWQESLDDGITWSDVVNGGTQPEISGATNWKLLLSNVPVNYHNRQYKCKLTASCPPTIFSNQVALNVRGRNINFTQQPANCYINSNCSASFTVKVEGYIDLYQWQISSDGVNWTDLTNGGTNPTVIGANSDALILENIPQTMINNFFRCKVQNLCSPVTFSDAAQLLGNSTYNIVYQVTNQNALPGGILGSTVTWTNWEWSIPSYPSGFLYNVTLPPTNTNNLSYQWQVSTDGGLTFNNLIDGGTNPAYAGTQTPGLVINNIAASMNGYKFRCLAYSDCFNAISDTGTLSVVSCTGVTDVDGNFYDGVAINNQCWMKPNLKTTKFNDNTVIPKIEGFVEWPALSTPAFCWYNNDSITYAPEYGALYNFYAVNTNKLCPVGWHVPTEEEWRVLFRFVDLLIAPLVEVGNAHWNPPIVEATNSTNFTAIPGGSRYFSGNYAGLGQSAFFWSSTSGINDATIINFKNVSTTIFLISSDKRVGASIRCLRDN